MARPKGSREPLSALTDQQKRFYLRLRAKELGPDRAIRVLYEAYEDAYKYSKPSFTNYESKPQTQAALAEYAKDIDAKAVKVSFAQRGIRVNSLIDVARILLERIRAEDEKGDEANPTALTRLCGEFRSTLSTIREEVDPLGGSDNLILSSFEQFLKQQSKVFTDSTQKQLGSDKWNSQIPEIQKN